MHEVSDRRALVDLALSAGKRYMSERTGLIHYCYEEGSSKETIPIFENLCYVLALFRTHVLDHVLEGKERLKHLLAFQYEDGRFPIYLHEYPNHVGSMRTAYPLYLIDKHFSKVIEAPLRSAISKNLTLPLPPETLSSSKEAGLIALHKSALGHTLAPLEEFWDSTLDLYVGPLGDERQRAGEIDTTLFDLFMGKSPRILKPHPIHLHAALVFYGEEEGDPVTETAPLPVGKGYHLFRKVWQEGDFLHTLVCQDKKMARDEDLFVYPEEIPDEKSLRELTFYTNRHQEKELYINGEKGTVFRLGDEISIVSPENALTLIFTLAEGEGEVIGQLSFGNRPAEIRGSECLGPAFDHKISLRTLRRSSSLKVRLQIL